MGICMSHNFIKELDKELAKGSTLVLKLVKNDACPYQWTSYQNNPINVTPTVGHIV